ncbi:MAG: malate dehydrogenase [Armatimonadetes bacterium]|nr:malate dehydrogenase [Armatimonadota bacterium]
MKISIIGGAGRVGSNTAFVLQLMGLGSQLALIDVNTDGAAGEALDLLHGAAFTSAQRISSGGMEELAGSDIVVVTAGLRRKPDESRLDLINRNVQLFVGILDGVRAAPLPADSTLIVVTNPVDILTQLAVDRSGFPPDRVLGLGTVLDTLRFRSLLGEHFRTDPTQVAALILGEHGDSMVPIWSTASVNGVPLTSLTGYDPQRVGAIFDRTRTSGAEVIKRKGGAGYAVGVAIAEVVEAIVKDTGSVLPVSTLQAGLYGIRDVCLSVATRVGRKGAEERLEMELWPKEEAALQQSADSLRATLSKVKVGT